MDLVVVFQREPEHERLQVAGGGGLTCWTDESGDIVAAPAVDGL